jgi:hypothetical protein
MRMKYLVTKEANMVERLAITGYVSDDVAKQLQAQQTGFIEVSPERGYHDVVMKVDGANIMKVRTGASVQSETLVQLILRDSVVETVSKTTTHIHGVSLFRDPILTRLTATATAKSIAV